MCSAGKARHRLFRIHQPSCPDASGRPVVRFRRVSGLEESLTRHVPRCRLVVFAFTLAVLLSLIAAQPVHAQNQDLSLSVTDVVEVEEGDTAVFTVTRTDSGTDMVTVDYATGAMTDTATAGEDYWAESGELMFPPGMTSKTIRVDTREDQEQENPESFTVKLTDKSDMELDTGEGRIRNVAPIFSWGGTVSVSTPTLTIPEGGTASYSLRLTEQPADDGWWVRLHVDGVVRYDGIYNNDDPNISPDRESTENTISWVPSVGWDFTPRASATQWKTISIQALEDDDDEDEVITFRHEVWDEKTECPDYLHPDNLPVVTVRIIDNDRGGGTRPSLSIQDATVVEGDEARFNVSVTPGLAGDQTVTVNYETVDGTAKAGTDYEARMGALTFEPGDENTVQTIFVRTVDDEFHEPKQSFTVVLSNASGATLADAIGEATISDDDLPKLSIANASPVTEGSPAQFEVTLTPATSQTVTVRYETADVTTTADSDYETTSDTLTFTEGETRKTISIETLDDMVRESDERFTVTLSSPSGVTLNDPEFVVTLTPPSSETVTVYYATADVTTTAGSDYETTSDTLTFTAGETTKTISVQTLTTRTRNRTNASR